jgi:hypothetical protein
LGEDIHAKRSPSNAGQKEHCSMTKSIAAALGFALFALAIALLVLQVIKNATVSQLMEAAPAALPGSHNPASAQSFPDAAPAAVTSTLSPAGFRGPTGLPRMIGPKSDPPNY